MNKLKGKKPWSLSFSFGRALQQSTLKAWAGKEENIGKAQAALLTRAKANSEATLGTYKGDAKLGEGAAESLHVKDYKYWRNLQFLLLLFCFWKTILRYVYDSVILGRIVLGIFQISVLALGF